MPKKILVAGASGFIGKALVAALLEDEQVHVVGLSRKERKSDHPRLEWRKCDLYSLKDLKAAMEGCDRAYYLVHSMLPSAALSQGEFYDFDLLMADNFMRAAKLHHVNRIVYLGGLIPENAKELSWHLKSRLEVEETLKKSTAKCITLRAGLIIGPDGSSFTILQRLVERLTIMILPSWTQTKMEPIALADTIRILVRAMKDESIEERVYDIGGKEQLSYRDLILTTGKVLKKHTITYDFNLIPLSLSRFWVSLITQTPKSLVYPLVLSLKYAMLVNPARAWPYPQDIQTSLEESLRTAVTVDQPHTTTSSAPTTKDVRSIQRLPFPPNKNAEWITSEYFRWLPRFFRPFIQVHQQGNRLTFGAFGLTLLILEKSDEWSSPDRQLMYIKGGLLAQGEGRGRLEFREVLDKQYIMAAIHEFRPRLSWLIYKNTQALIHLWVMKAFAKHLMKDRFYAQTASKA